MISTKNRRLYNLATAVLLAQTMSLWIQRLWVAWRTPLDFDDAYMFARYATNIRHGLGFSWNLDGAHTYGPTSLLWQLAVLLLSFLPLGTWKMLTLGSWLISIGAVLAISWAVARNARSELLSSPWRVLPLVAVPVTLSDTFASNQCTGMETMMAVLLCAVFIGCALRGARGEMRPEITGLVGWLLFLTRPDAGIVVVLFPALLYSLRFGSGRWKDILRIFGVFFAGVVVEFALCEAYFHTMVPLSFYMKSGHGYIGVAVEYHPQLWMVFFLAGCELYLTTLLLLVRKVDWRLVVCFLVPAAGTFAYLFTVDQIMGLNSRFYVPYLALIVVPTLLVVDRWIAEVGVSLEQQWPGRTLLIRGVGVAVLMLGFLAVRSQKVLAKIRDAEHSSHFVYDPAVVQVAAKVPLRPLEWHQAIETVTDFLVAPLPRGATVAATEVGYLGSHAPQVNIIDLAGLNDTQIALHGFHMESLLAEKPDVIWLPQSNYTYQRGVMISDPAFLAQYDLFAGAGIYGVALRKDSPYREQIEHQMNVFWKAEYPDYKMEDYLVKAAHWSGQKRLVVD